MDWEEHLQSLLDVCWYICRHGHQAYQQVESWPPRKIRRAAESISRLIEAEYTEPKKRGGGTR